MSTIDRRAFIAGCLAVTVAGCDGGIQKSTAVAPRNCVTAPAGVSFVTPIGGCWTQVGSAQVYVIT